MAVDNSDRNRVAQVFSEIDRRRQDAICLLAALVRQRSTLGNELGAQKVIHSKWLDLGLDSEMWEFKKEEISKHPAYNPVPWGYAGRPNVTSVFPAAASGGRSLILNGHMDVVSPEPVDAWTHDPWGADIVGNRMYGRGAGDMKSGIAMYTLAVEALMAAGVRLRGDVHLESVIEEEGSGNGTLACRLRGLRANGAIVCENYGLQANLMMMGVFWFSVAVRGRAGHVAAAGQRVNAIEKCFPLIAALRALEQEMNDELNHPTYKRVGHAVNLNVGMMHGGDWPSTVPALCRFDCRLSFPPGVELSTVRCRVEDCLRRASGRDAWLSKTPPAVEYYGLNAQPCEHDPRGSLLGLLSRYHSKVVGTRLRFVVSTGTDDSRYFANDFGIPAVGYGPTGAQAHATDEFVELDSVFTGAKVLTAFIMDWCGVM